MESPPAVPGNHASKTASQSSMISVNARGLPLNNTRTIFLSRALISCRSCFCGSGSVISVLEPDSPLCSICSPIASTTTSASFARVRAFSCSMKACSGVSFPLAIAGMNPNSPNEL